MSFSMSPHLRRGIALCAVVLATGGLILYRAPAAASSGDSSFLRPPTLLVGGKNSAAFAGPGAHGMVSLSHSRVLSGSENAVFADVRGHELDHGLRAAAVGGDGGAGDVARSWEARKATTSAISSGCEARCIGVVSPSVVMNSGPEGVGV